MLCILEGPDGAGKSTLADALAQRIGYVDMRHSSQLKRDPIAEYIGDLHMYKPGIGMHIIYDRHYLGELIYGPLYRGESRITPGMQIAIENYLNRQGALLVHVTHEVDVLRARCKELGESFLQESDIFFVHKQYIEEVDESKIRFKMTVKDATSEVINDIIWLAGKLEERVSQ